MASSVPQIVYGAAAIGGLDTKELRDTFDLLKRHNVTALDTAFVYVWNPGQCLRQWLRSDGSYSLVVRQHWASIKYQSGLRSTLRLLLSCLVLCRSKACWTAWRKV